MDLFLWNRIAIRVIRLSKGKIQDPAVNVNCSEFEVNNWIISEFIFQKLVPIVGVTPYPINELALMVSAVCRLKPTHIFEWGTHIGKSRSEERRVGKECRYGCAGFQTIESDKNVSQ